MASQSDAHRYEFSAGGQIGPQRTCINCRRKGGQSSFFRIARGSGGGLGIVERGAPTGRSAYVCKKEECIKGALAKDRLARALRKPVSAAEREGLERDLTCKLR